jgi:hypothetical protein
MPQADDLLKYRAAQFGLTVPQNLPYGLDVWAPKKVLNIEWDDKGNVTLVSLRPGAWETELITLAQTEVVDIAEKSSRTAGDVGQDHDRD